MLALIIIIIIPALSTFFFAYVATFKTCMHLENCNYFALKNKFEKHLIISILYLYSRMAKIEKGTELSIINPTCSKKYLNA